MFRYVSGTRPTVRPGYPGINPCRHAAPVPPEKDPAGPLRSGYWQERTRISLGDVVPGEEIKGRQRCISFPPQSYDNCLIGDAIREELIAGKCRRR